MALHITYKPGEQQSHQAARYFQQALDPLVESLTSGLEERTYRILGGEEGCLSLRTWCRDPLNEDQLHVVLDRILAVRTDLHQLEQRPHDAQGLAPLAKGWLSPHLDGADLFVELTIGPEAPADSNAPPVFSMGLYRGRAVLISTDTALFTWLQENVFGLSLAGRGSYLLELLDGTRPALQHAS